MSGLDRQTWTNQNRKDGSGDERAERRKERGEHAGTDGKIPRFQAARFAAGKRSDGGRAHSVAGITSFCELVASTYNARHRIHQGGGMRPADISVEKKIDRRGLVVD